MLQPKCRILYLTAMFTGLGESGFDLIYSEPRLLRRFRDELNGLVVKYRNDHDVPNNLLFPPSPNVARKYGQHNGADFEEIGTELVQITEIETTPTPVNILTTLQQTTVSILAGIIFQEWVKLSQHRELIIDPSFTDYELFLMFGREGSNSITAALVLVNDEFSSMIPSGEHTTADHPKIQLCDTVLMRFKKLGVDLPSDFNYQTKP